ncbi:MAG: glycosyltransferase WbuB, partial [Planctomycetaceae bacterium]
MKILFFSHYFPPEGNAPASRTYEHCVRWVLAGHDVTVITCVPNVPDGIPYEGYRNRWRSQREVMEGIHVIRVWTFLAPNNGFLKRILNYLSY